MKRFQNPGWLVAACCLSGLASPALAQPEIYGEPDSSKFILIPPDADDWTRHFRVGALVGLNIGASFHTQGTFGSSGNNPAQGVYDDGYVKDDATGNAGGLTSNWGYTGASQYDAATHTLQMHATSSFSTTQSGDGDGKPYPGFELAYGANFWYWRSARVGWELGFGLLPITISESFANAPATINRTTYNFDTGNLVPPGAPYQGGAGGTGPLIPRNYFSSSTEQIDGGTVSGTQSLNVNLYTLRLGPTFYWDLSQSVGMSLGAGPAIGLVSGDYSYNETISAGGFSVNNGRISGADIVFGGYVNGTVMYHVNDFGQTADLYLSAQYMPMSDAAFGGNGREGRLDLGGQVYISAGINWPF